MKKLSKKEIKELKKVLDLFEQHEYLSMGYKHINGAFSHADMKEYDDEWIRIDLVLGVQDGCSNDIRTEYWKLRRDILRSKTTLVEKVNEIEED